MPDFPSRMLFRPIASCPRLRQPIVLDGDLADWSGIPALPPLGELDGERTFAQVYVAWSEEGLYLAERCAKPGGTVTVNRRRPASGDGLQVWIDTRAAQTAHRASRFCHHFLLLPRGGGPGRGEPVAWQANLRRARERPPLCDPSQIRLASRVEGDSYCLEVLLPTHLLNGFEPRAGERIGFNYFAHDVPGGKQVWSSPRAMPFDTDPSLWGLLELQD